MKYYLIAGEASGDLHGSNLLKGLVQQDPEGEYRCWGGDLMQQAGATLVKHYKDTAIMGFWEVLKKIFKIFGNFRRCKEDILEWEPDVLILIDYPGFNLRMARFAKKHGIPVFYYIAPKVWAWKEKRVFKIKKFVDRLFIIFPFEIEYFRKWGLNPFYNGNPLLDSIMNNEKLRISKEDFCKAHNLDPHRRKVALLAGSRKAEVLTTLGKELAVAAKHPELDFLIAGVKHLDISLYHRMIDSFGGALENVHLLIDETYPILKHSNAAIINSGTASLEAALIGVPQVVCYAGSEISYQIAKRLVKLNYISLANLILDKGIFKELIQHDATPQNLDAELSKLLDNKEYVQAMQEDYASVRQMLGGSGTSAKVADAMIKELRLIKGLQSCTQE